MGFARADGSVGTRNEVWILPTVGCVGRLGERLAQRGTAMVDLMRRTSLPGLSIDGVHAFNHPFGCSQLGADLDGTAAILAALAMNPNAGGVLLLGLGCDPTSWTHCWRAFRVPGWVACGSCARNRKAMNSPPGKPIWPNCCRLWRRTGAAPSRSRHCASA
jgi:hypothetical protein